MQKVKLVRNYQIFKAKNLSIQQMTFVMDIIINKVFIKMEIKRSLITHLR